MDMAANRIGAVLEVLGMTGVIASLIFVGLEIKQSRDIAVADIYQQRSAMWIDIALSKYSPEQYETVVDKFSEENFQLTDFDVELLRNLLAARFTYYENLHFQNQLGMTPKEEWENVKVNILGDLSKPCVPGWWRSMSKFWRASFASEVDALLNQLQSQTCDIPELS